MPRLTDDGSIVTLDLHGTRLGDALDLAQRAVKLAAERGRGSIRIVHGSSTSDPLARNRTIKHALLDAVDTGRMGGSIVSVLRGEDVLTLGLSIGAPTNPRRLTLRDVLQ